MRALLSLKNALKSSYEELVYKVTWTKWETLQQATVIIVVSTLLISLLVWLMDSASHIIFKFLYSIFR